jgi:hypothetical protein
MPSATVIATGNSAVLQTAPMFRPVQRSHAIDDGQSLGGKIVLQLIHIRCFGVLG